MNDRGEIVHDVVVVGGGPGGLYAARSLALQGYEVVVTEEHDALGLPVHCTGVLGTEAYEEFLLPREAILNELRTARFYSPTGQTFDYAADSVEAIVVDRDQFDHRLAESAHKAGVALCLGHKVTDIDIGETNVVVHCSNIAGPIRARACILAAGANYALQRRLQLGFPPHYLQSAQLELPAQPLEKVELHFGTQVAPQGFAWVVPVKR